MDFYIGDYHVYDNQTLFQVGIKEYVKTLKEMGYSKSEIHHMMHRNLDWMLADNAVNVITMEDYNAGVKEAFVNAVEDEITRQ